MIILNVAPYDNPEGNPDNPGYHKACYKYWLVNHTSGSMYSPVSEQGSSIGRVFRPLLRRRRKMAALPLPAAILDDLIPSFRFREWGHPRWRPEAEGPPSCASASIGVEKRAPSLGWRHFRRRHLESKMAVPHVTSGGRRDSHEILRKGWS